MTNKKTTKQQLVASIVLLFMCFSMLLGTTFAWFTDSATSANNKIVAGTLDVQLWMYNDTTKQYDEITDKSAPIFGEGSLAQNNNAETLWEPGKTQVVYLKIVNNGSLDLKYNVAINVRDTKDDKDLYKALQYTITPDADPDVVTSWDAAKGSGFEVGNNVAKVDDDQVLKAEAEHCFALSVHMLEEAGNQYMGGSVEFDIKVAATQLASEEDSFDNTYDEDAYFTDAIVTNEEELKTAIAAASDGAIIGIKGNVTWTTGAGIGSTPFVENSATRSVSTKSTVKNLTLVGLEDGATFTAIGSGVGAIGIDDGTVTFKNLKIVDESVSYAENNWEFGYLEFRGNTVFENCNIVNAIMMEGDSATFNNCSFNSNKDNEYAVWVADGNATFTNCTFKGARGLKTHEAYGSEVDIITVIGCKFIELSKKPGMAIGTVNPDTTIYIVDNEFIGTQAGDQGLYSYETDTDVTTFKFTYKDNLVPSSEGNGLYKDENGVFYATTSGGLSEGIKAAATGDIIVLAQDVTYTGNGYADITKDIILDLGGNTLNTTSLGVVAKAGTIKNGTVTNPVGGRAALRTWSGVSIENVVVESPLNGGITVASGNTIPSIKNVVINSKTYGIELQYGASVGSIENVTINAGENGIVSQAGTIGNMTNCVIEAKNAGIWGQLKGVYDLKLDVDSTNVIKGGKYGVYLFDEGENIVPVGTAYFNYIDASVFNGGVKDMEFAFGQKGKLVITVDGKTLLTSANIKAVTLTSNTGYMLTGDFGGNNVALTMPVGVENVIFDGTGATNINELIVTQNGTLIDNANDVLGERSGNVTVQNFNVLSQINVFACKTEVVVQNNTAEALMIHAGNCAVKVLGNTIDANFESHPTYRNETSTWNTNDYGIALNIFEYNLWLDGNTVTDSKSHAIGINGWEGTFDTGVDNKIESFKGNTITVNSTVKTDRAAFKVWDDETYASNDDDTNVVNATAQAFINAVLADGSNTFNIIEGYDHTIFSIYNVNKNN